ncbi:MAG TPA: protein kinase [Pyrinomonadaceae bacterium]|nr:protein kinase [Pyrinomonadaceae bacterium]
MMDPDPYIGQTLDEKYRLERLLGRGGMGAVYLATHLGTERYVALKLITPQFMRNQEFVARFKREARAAGRLRHPNVVDVTDFGFAHAGKENVAYLVMEYLDGCTLGDILIEEKRLPLEWVVDILEQVCSAVNAAHQEGIVHRDLKPENIWLEPTRLGGYRVKVLDFGIAKLAEVDAVPTAAQSANTITDGGATSIRGERLTAAHQAAATIEPVNGGDRGAEFDTRIQGDPHERPPATEMNVAGLTAVPVTDEGLTQHFQVNEEPADAAATAIMPQPAAGSDDGDRTLMFDQATLHKSPGQKTTLKSNTTRGMGLTRVGAIMGTPLYMSPEQCAGKPSDSRSDIYSIGVIAYQMLTGEPPFAGKTGDVMQEHIHEAPPPLQTKNKKVGTRVSQVVMNALAKSPDERPQTAAAFSSALRAQSEGVGSLYRRAFSLYSEYFPKFFKLSLIAHIPVFITTAMVIVFQVAENAAPRGLNPLRIGLVIGLVISGLLQIVAYFLAAAAISGTTAIIVTQLTLVPMRPVELRLAFAVLKRRWRPFLNTAIRVTLRIVIGWCLFVIPGIVMSIRYALYAPVVLMEGLQKKAARVRARELASRSWRTVIIVTVLQFFIPIVFSALLGRFTTVERTSTGIHVSDRSMTSQVYQQIVGMLNVFIVPLISIVPALLYLKMRQLGGESLSAIMTEIEETGDQRTQWQQRMRTGLTMHSSRGSRARSTTN